MSRLRIARGLGGYSESKGWPGLEAIGTRAGLNLKARTEKKILQFSYTFRGG